MIGWDEAVKRTDERLSRLAGDSDAVTVPLTDWRFMAIGTDVPSGELLKQVREDMASVRETLLVDPVQTANLISGLLLSYFWLGHAFGEGERD